MKKGDKKLEDRIEMIVKQFSGQVDENDGALVPEVAIKGSSGHIYCYSTMKNRMIRISRGTKAYILKEEHEKGISLIYTFDGRILEIQEDELIFTGFD